MTCIGLLTILKPTSPETLRKLCKMALTFFSSTSNNLFFCTIATRWRVSAQHLINKATNELLTQLFLSTVMLHTDLDTCCLWLGDLVTDKSSIVSSKMPWIFQTHVRKGFFCSPHLTATQRMCKLTLKIVPFVRPYFMNSLYKV